MADAFDLTSTFVHLGTDSSATPIPDFEWSEEFLQGYEARFGDEPTDGVGRLLCVTEQESTWSTWERHPAGEEVVVLLSGRIDLIQLIDGVEHVVELRPLEAVVNPAGVWHRAVVHQPGLGLFVTPGSGTEHRAYDGATD